MFIYLNSILFNLFVNLFFCHNVSELNMIVGDEGYGIFGLAILFLYLLGLLFLNNCNNTLWFNV